MRICSAWMRAVGYKSDMYKGKKKGAPRAHHIPALNLENDRCLAPLERFGYSSSTFRPPGPVYRSLNS